MAPPAPKQPALLCQFPIQLLVVAVLFAIGASLPAGDIPHPVTALLALVAIAISAICFAKAKPPEE
ncbi:hypothetical protein [Thiohalorhabdus sp.]|uniref:hypothetical protein n=1 Tax=Thiohalorhabdus sp. TaxID=3094134 RepID=UPI002FC39520